jgi:putative spermidine/putrescine transport system ATP-binding protein
MNAGVLEQMDVPQAIYARPATLFVATFIGTMNRLDGGVDSRGLVHAGPFTAITPADGGAPASPLVVGIRPEDLILQERGDGVSARIDSDIDLGHYRRVTLSVEGASLVAFVPKSQSVPHEGVTVRPSRMLLYADGSLVGVAEPALAATVSG